jgi:cobalt/nickel transport system ATP-binding protein
MEIIDLKGVSFQYEEIIALKNINLQIKKGESVALLGPNGSGKSTLLRLINGLYPSSEGIYLFEGKEVNKKTLHEDSFAKQLHQRMGFVFQNADVQLFCTNVYDEIAFGVRQMGMKEEKIKKRVSDCIRLLHLDGLESRVPYHLSGGEKHKVAIASVLVMNPDVICFDEPMSGLDPRTADWFLDFLRHLQMAGKTFIIATHQLAMVPQMAQRAIIMDEAHEIIGDIHVQELEVHQRLLLQANLISDRKVDAFEHK